MNVEVHHPSTTKINSDKDNIPTSTSPAAMKVDGNAFDTLPEHPPNLDSIQHDVTTENSVEGSQVNGNYNIQTSDHYSFRESAPIHQFNAAIQQLRPTPETLGIQNMG